MKSLNLVLYATFLFYAPANSKASTSLVIINPQCAAELKRFDIQVKVLPAITGVAEVVLQIKKTKMIARGTVWVSVPIQDGEFKLEYKVTPGVKFITTFNIPVSQLSKCTIFYAWDAQAVEGDFSNCYSFDLQAFKTKEEPTNKEDKEAVCRKKGDK